MRQQSSAHFVPVHLTMLMLTSVLISGLVSAIALPVQTVAAAPASTSSEVNLRSGPGESYDVLSVVPAGAAISVDGDAVDGFFPVTYNGVSGWISASYVYAGEQAPVYASEPAPVSAYNDPAYQPDPNTAYYDAGTVVVYDTDAGNNQQRGNRRRNRNNNQPPSTTTITTNPDPSLTGASAPANEQEIVSIIHQAAAAHGQNPDDMVRVARCESSLNPRAVDPSGSYHGLFQFVPSTFAGTPYGGQDIYDPAANANAAAWMWSEGRKSEWVCQ